MERSRAPPARRFGAVGRVGAKGGAGRTIRVCGNASSVSSRSIGERVEVRRHAEPAGVRYARTVVARVPRSRGRGRHRINDQQVLDGRVREPGAFAAHRYRGDLFPATTFRTAADALRSRASARADREYLRLLGHAARDGEASVDAALRATLASDGIPPAGAVPDRVRALPITPTVPVVAVGPVGPSAYDRPPSATGGTTPVEDQRGRGGGGT